jgi:long-chain acyl-CoA synthetase
MFPERWLPSALAILVEGFTEQNGQLNSTLKMVRTKIVDRYRERITALYTTSGKELCDPANREAIRVLGEGKDHP